MQDGTTRSVQRSALSPDRLQASTWLSETAMMFRLSQKLNTKIKAGALSALPLDEDALTDWSAHIFLGSRTQYILLCNSQSLYSMLLYGRGINSASEFVERAMRTIQAQMEFDGFGTAYERFIAPAGAAVRFAKALNRSVTGSMNDMTKQVLWSLAAGHSSLTEIGSRLHLTPMSALARDRSTHGFPRDAFDAMIVSAGSQRSP